MASFCESVMHDVWLESKYLLRRLSFQRYNKVDTYQRNNQKGLDLPMGQFLLNNNRHKATFPPLAAQCIATFPSTSRVVTSPPAFMINLLISQIVCSLSPFCAVILKAAAIWRGWYPLFSSMVFWSRDGVEDKSCDTVDTDAVSIALDRGLDG